MTDATQTYEGIVKTNILIELLEKSAYEYYDKIGSVENVYHQLISNIKRTGMRVTPEIQPVVFDENHKPYLTVFVTAYYPSLRGNKCDQAYLLPFSCKFKESEIEEAKNYCAWLQQLFI